MIRMGRRSNSITILWTLSIACFEISSALGRGRSLELLVQQHRDHETAKSDPSYQILPLERCVLSKHKILSRCPYQALYERFTLFELGAVRYSDICSRQHIVHREHEFSLAYTLHASISLIANSTDLSQVSLFQRLHFYHVVLSRFSFA